MTTDFIDQNLDVRERPIGSDTIWQLQRNNFDLTGRLAVAVW
jgi:hypothetical protein